MPTTNGKPKNVMKGNVIMPGESITFTTTYGDSNGSGGGSGSVTMNDCTFWQPMNTAPRDGTVIEVMCTYGVAPWYGLFKWTNTLTAVDGAVLVTQDSRWVGASPGRESSGIAESEHLTWRPYHGDVNTYVDPTGGAQDTSAYWIGAVTVKHGLPNHFEAKPKQSLWRRFVNRIRGEKTP